MGKFIVLKKEIKLADVFIRENEIGIVESESEDSCVIHFVVSDEKLDISKQNFEFFDTGKTGDDFPKKVCNVCHRLLETEDQFSKKQNGKGGNVIRRPSCKECRKGIDGVAVKGEDKRKWEEKKPRYELFTCPICQKTTIPELTSKIVLDHDHDNGEVRGWICDSCNTGLGRFKDDVALLKRAIDYLEKNVS